jgi:phosphomannomutase/phosphoglucomutase
LEKDKLKCPEGKKEAILADLTEAIAHLNPDTLDGVKIWFSDQSAILIRPSGTEPIYRFYAEATTKERANKLIREYKEKLREIISSGIDS